jgi:AraC-like DNA-binding protein
MDFNAKLIPFSLHPLGLIESFIGQGAKLDGLLRNTGLSEQSVHVKGLKISFMQQARIVENGLRMCANPGMGLVIGSTMDWSFHGSLGSIVHCSPSLADACASFRRYLQIAQPLYKLFFSQPDYFFDKGNYLVSPIHTAVDEALSPQLARFELEYRLAILLRLYDLCGNKSAVDTSVLIGLNYPEPSYVDLLKQLPLTEVKFNCRFPYIAVGREFFYIPWRELRRPLYDKIIERCEEEFVQANLDNSYAEKVQWLIHKNFQPDVRLQDIAQQMQVSPRALTRKLAVENTSFRQIFNRVRMEFTILHLRESRLTVDQVADVTGFSCSASLRRAVKSWQSAAIPQTYVAQHNHEGEEHAL